MKMLVNLNRFSIFFNKYLYSKNCLKSEEKIYLFIHLLFLGNQQDWRAQY